MIWVVLTTMPGFTGEITLEDLIPPLHTLEGVTWTSDFRGYDYQGFSKMEQEVKRDCDRVNSRQGLVRLFIGLAGGSGR